LSFNIIGGYEEVNQTIVGSSSFSIYFSKSIAILAICCGVNVCGLHAQLPFHLAIFIKKK
jgi:hypothetical protein